MSVTTGRRRTTAAAAVLLAAALALAGCSAGADEPADHLGQGREAAGDDVEAGAAHDEHSTTAPKPRPLRNGEERITLTMPEPYSPSAPTGVGTDDYRCFLLDPGLDHDAFISGTNVIPGNRESVHHVILFRVAPDQVEEAEQVDADTDGPGWTCFGGSGVGRVPGPRRRAVAGRLGARWPRVGPATRHRHPAGEGEPDRDAGPLQPARRRRA